MKEAVYRKKQGTARELCKAFLLVVGFFFYTSLNHIFLALPPMIGLLFIFYLKTSRQNEWITTFGIVFCLVLFEINHSEYVGILPIIFVIADWLVIKKFRLLFEENLLFIFIYVFLIYITYYFALYIFGTLKIASSLQFMSSLISYVFYESCLGIVYEKIKHKI